MPATNLVLCFHCELVVRESDAHALFLLWATADRPGSELGSGPVVSMQIVDPELEA